MKTITRWSGRNAAKSFAFLFGLGLLLLLFAPPALTPALAVQIKNVQSGEVFFDANDITQNFRVAAVNQNKTLILLYPNVDNDVNNYTGNAMFTADFESDTGVVVSRDYASVQAWVKWYVVEFADGVTVQRGISSFAPGSYTNPDYTQKVITLPNSLTDYHNAFVIVQERAQQTNDTTEEICYISGFPMSNNTQIELDRMASNDNMVAVNCMWQVVEFKHTNVSYPDFQTWSGELHMLQNQASVQATGLSPNIGTLS
jgi:hypothetical protein